MIARLALVLVLAACGKSKDGAHDTRSEILAERSRALARLSGTNADAMTALLEQLRAKRDAARASKDPAEVAKLDAEIDELYAKGKQLSETYEVERTRVEQLSDRCFAKPTPPDCKLPPE